MSYKVTNKLECPVKSYGTLFGPKETKILVERPYSDKFHVEKVEETEQNKTERRRK